LLKIVSSLKHRLLTQNKESFACTYVIIVRKKKIEPRLIAGMFLLLFTYPRRIVVTGFSFSLLHRFDRLAALNNFGRWLCALFSARASTDSWQWPRLVESPHIGWHLFFSLAWDGHFVAGKG